MASEKLMERVRGYEKYVEVNGADDTAINAYCQAAQYAIVEEKDVDYGLKLTAVAKDLIQRKIKKETKGGDFALLEWWAQQNGKTNMLVIKQMYEMLLLEAPHKVDSFKLYIERDRKQEDRFYEPRRDTLIRISDAVQRIENNELDILFIHQPPRTGKLLADDTPVMTADGWKNHGDLCIGDKVVGSDGNFTEVVKVYPKDVADYKVTLSNGEVFYCHGNHEWTLYDRASQGFRTRETKSLVGKLRNGQCRNGSPRNRYLIPSRQPMTGEHKDLAVPPYVLGAWIGDGTNTKPWITDPQSDFAIIEKIINSGYSLRKMYTHKTTGVKSYVFETKLMKDLQIYDMCYYEKRREKRIPEEYLTASLSQRLELLAGLIDTDGCLRQSENRYDFSTTSVNLKNDVEDLINTFGWRVCTTVAPPCVSSSGIIGRQDCYVISFNPTMEIPCVLERKQLKTFSKQRRISIVNVEKCEPRQGNCVSVSNADGLYAVGRTMQLTHNSGDITMDIAWHCARNMEKSNLYVTYKEGLGGAFLDGVQEIYTDPTYRFADVFPDCKIVYTDAKNNKIDLGRKKKYRSLSGKGLESGLNGEYDATGWLVVDDPLEGVQDVMSKEVLKRKQTIFDNNVLSRKKESCKLILIGTCWAVSDIFGTYLEFLELHHGNLRYEVIRIPALDPDTDESNFNYKYGVGFSTDYYHMLRDKHEMNDDMAGFLAQYQQSPIERDGAVFNPENMNYYDELPAGEPVKVIAHCDVALGGNDFLAFPVAYYYENPDGTMTGYIEDVVFDKSEKHITQPQVAYKIKKHKIKNVHFEANQGGEAYKDEVERLVRSDKDYKEPLNITSSWAQVTKRKEQRIWDNAQEIRELYFKSPTHRDEQYRKFMQNLFSFSMNMRKRANDDAPDALSGLVDFNRKGSGVRKATISSSWI